METPTVYVICDKNCKFEGMTKEQILTAITQAVNEGTISNIDAGFVQTIKTINGVALKFFVGAQSEYNELSEEDKKDLFAIITNGTEKEDIIKYLDSLAERMERLENNSDASHATTADTANSANYATKAGKLTDLGGAFDNVARHVWFSDSEESGMPRKDDDFKYNPSTNTLTVPYIDGEIKNAVISSSSPCQLILGEDALTGITMPDGKTYDDITMIQLIDSGAQPLSMIGFRRAGSEVTNFTISGMYTAGAYTRAAMLKCSFDINTQNAIKIYTHEYYETEFREDKNHITTLSSQNGDYQELFYAYVILYFR